MFMIGQHLEQTFIDGLLLLCRVFQNFKLNVRAQVKSKSIESFWNAEQGFVKIQSPKAIFKHYLFLTRPVAKKPPLQNRLSTTSNMLAASKPRFSKSAWLNELSSV